MWVWLVMIKVKTPEKKTRITLDLTPDFYRRLEDLEAVVGSESKAGLIREALQLYEYVAQKVKDGYTFKIQKGGDEKELVFFKLPAHE
jgi:hypothetical protein